MENIKVSVIVPVYNVEKYVGECLDSLEKQTLKEIEVIIVNDGSTDDSGIIIGEYVERNSNFFLIEQANGGLSVARNTGLEMAHGEYIYFLDSDDYLIENALEELYERAKIDNLDVLKFVAYTFMEQSKQLSWEVDGGYKYKGEYPGVDKGIDILEKFIENGDTEYPSCCLIFTKREVIEKNELRFCEGIIHEDNLFHWELMSLSERVAILNKPLYCRRIRTGSITQTIDWNNKNRSMCISAEKAELFINEHPEIKGKTTDWYVIYFISMMINNWQQMNLELQRSPEIKEYFKRVNRIAKNHNYGESRYVWIYMKSVTLFKFYIWVVTVATKIFRRE